MKKKFHKYLISAPNLEILEGWLNKAMQNLPPNATIESTNYQQFQCILNLKTCRICRSSSR